MKGELSPQIEVDYLEKGLAMQILIGLLGFVVVSGLWEIVCLLILRAFGIGLPLVFLLHFGLKREHDLIAALKDRSRGSYILNCGFLFFGCPLILGLIAIDRIEKVNGFGSPAYFVGTAIVLMIVAFAGVSIGDRVWQKSRGGSALPVIERQT